MKMHFFRRYLQRGLNAFYEKVNTLPLSEEKEIISLFKSAMSMDSWVEEFLTLQEQIDTTVQPLNRNPVLEEVKNNMEINEEINLRELYIDPVEKIMDEFVGTPNFHIFVFISC